MGTLARKLRSYGDIIEKLGKLVSKLEAENRELKKRLKKYEE